MTQKITKIKSIQVKYYSLHKTVEVLDMPVTYFEKVFKEKLCDFPWNFQQGYPKLQYFTLERTECTCCGNVTTKKIDYQEEKVMQLAVPGFWNN